MKHKTAIILSALLITALSGCDASNVSDTTISPTVTTVGEITAENTSSAQTAAENPDNNPEYSDAAIDCLPIDKSLDCEAILLEKADRLCTLMTDYLNLDSEKLIYKLGEPYKDENGMVIGSKVISDEMSCYADFKTMFSDSIYGGYLDYISSSGTYLFDIDGALYCSTHVGGFLGTDETWYIGCDVEDDKIVGHFAELRGLGFPEDNTAEYLNNEENYWFYDITVRNVDGTYVITDCREKSSGKNYEFYDQHGLCYNSGFADRSLITNEKVKPKTIT